MHRNITLHGKSEVKSTIHSNGVSMLLKCYEYTNSTLDGYGKGESTKIFQYSLVLACS